MSTNPHPWEQMYRKKGRTELSPFPRFYEVVEIFKHYGCERILDLGCGSGRHLVHLDQEGFDVVGMDISLTGLRLTNEWVETEGLWADVLQADMRENLPFKRGSFQGVFSTQVIHHACIREVRRTIQEIFRLLDHEGIAFVTVSARKDNRKHREIEPGTYVPMTGPEKGVPHHIFTEQEIRREFDPFAILDISLRAGGKVLAVLAQRA